MSQKPVTVDFLHPAVVRTFKNWGYISFFGCLAALIVLLFFSISYLKEVQTQQQQKKAIMPCVPTESTYCNNQAGFSFTFVAARSIFDDFSLIQIPESNGRFSFVLKPSSSKPCLTILCPNIGIHLMPGSQKDLQIQLQWEVISTPPEPNGVVLSQTKQADVEITLLRKYSPYGSYRKILFSRNGYVSEIVGPAEDASGCDFSRQALSDNYDRHSCGNPSYKAFMDEVATSLKIF